MKGKTVLIGLLVVFVFYSSQEPDEILARCRAKGLDAADLTGFGLWPAGLGVQQLSLPGFRGKR